MPVSEVVGISSFSPFPRFHEHLFKASPVPWVSAVLNPQKDVRCSARWVVIPRSARGCWMPDSILGPQTFFSAAARSIDFSAQLTLLVCFRPLVGDVGLIGAVLCGRCIWLVPLLSGKWLVGSWKIIAQSVRLLPICLVKSRWQLFFFLSRAVCFLSELDKLPIHVTYCWSFASLNFTLCFSLHWLAVGAQIHFQILVLLMGQWLELVRLH